MTMKEQVLQEIRQRNMPEVPSEEKPKKEPKPKKIPTKEEREAYRQRMIEKEEREAIKRMGIVEKNPRGKKKKEHSSEEPAKPAHSTKPVKAEKPKTEPKPKAKAKKNTKQKVKKIKTIELPNGDSLLIIYVPGGAQ